MGLLINRIVMDGAISLTVCWLMMLMSSTCGQMIKYSKDCKGENFSTPDHVSCPDEPFHINCSTHEVLTATVCFGLDESLSSNETTCNVSSGVCLDEYTASDDDMFKSSLDQCLWTTHECDIAVGADTFACNILDAKCISPFSDSRYHYITVFNMECVDGDTVFDICNVTEETSTLPKIGYIHSPGFPALVYGRRNCSHAFVTDEKKSFDFLIQRVHLNTNGDHVTISALMKDGSRGKHKTWYGTVDSHQNFTLGAAYGFLVEYEQYTSALNGFLFSFEVSAPPMEPFTSPSASPTTSSLTPPKASEASCEEPQPCGTSNVECNPLGLVLLVTWCITLMD